MSGPRERRKCATTPCVHSSAESFTHLSRQSQRRRNGLQRSGEVGEFLAPSIGLKTAHGGGRKLHGFAQFASVFATGTGTRAAMGDDGPGRIEVIQHFLAGIKASFEVTGGRA